MLFLSLTLVYPVNANQGVKIGIVKQNKKQNKTKKQKNQHESSYKAVSLTATSPIKANPFY